MKQFIIHTIFLFSFCISFAQNWNFKLKSKVELRTWALSSRAMKNSTYLDGATVQLLKGSEIIFQAATDKEGNFEMNIPSDGDYSLVINYAGSEPKKFAVSTRGVPPNKDDPNFKPSFNMVGIIMSKPAKDKKYLGLDQSHVQITYNDKAKTENKNYNYNLNMYDAEYLVIQKFCIAAKLGDMAMEKKNYDLAKIYYQAASGIIESETYPKDQLKKAEEGLKTEKTELKSRITNQSNQNSKQPIVSKQKENAAPAKKTVETGKSKHKTRRTL